MDNVAILIGTMALTFVTSLIGYIKYRKNYKMQENIDNLAAGIFWTGLGIFTIFVAVDNYKNTIDVNYALLVIAIPVIFFSILGGIDSIGVGVMGILDNRQGEKDGDIE